MPLLLFSLDAHSSMSLQEPWFALGTLEIRFRRGATLAFPAPASMVAYVSRVQVPQGQKKGSLVIALPCSLDPDARPGETPAWTHLAEMVGIVDREEERCSVVAVPDGRERGARSTPTNARAMFARMEDCAETELLDTLVTVLEVGCSHLLAWQSWS